MRGLFGRVDLIWCCVEKNDKLEVSERGLRCCRESQRKSHSAASAKAFYTTSIATSLNREFMSDHFYKSHNFPT
jgi:hypothetical protein